MQDVEGAPKGGLRPRAAAGPAVEVQQPQEGAQAPGAAWGNSVAKRAADVLGSALLLLATAPLWPVVALAIKLESPGPAFLRQFRAGRQERPFRLFKFRSMRELQASVEESERHSTRKERSAHRTTRFGRLLRQASLDELPQLLNVLLGHMSLVGPRPLVFGDVHDPYQIAPAEKAVDPAALQQWRRVRCQVRPGMTGLWQVSGRSSLPLEGWLKYDVEYVVQASWRLDLALLWRTVAVVLKGDGAC